MRMKQLFSILALVCMACSCDENLQDIFNNFDSPTYVEMDGEGYMSKEEHVATVNYPSISYDESSFSFRYTRTLYKDPEDLLQGKDQIDINLSVEHDGPLVVGTRYALEDMSVLNELSRGSKGYDLTDGWIIFHDIDKDGSYGRGYVSGSFEFNATLEGGSETVEIKKGSFDRLQMNINQKRN